MLLCASKVRETHCEHCLHYKNCTAQGRPLPGLARYIAWLQFEALPPIANALRRYCVKGLSLDAYAPDINEMEEGAYAVVRAHDETASKRVIFRLNLNGDEDAAAIKTLVFNTYVKAKRKAYHGTK